MCIILSCKAPIVLRPTVSGGHVVVGECFVQGLSKGEAFLGPLPRNFRVAKFWDEGSRGWTVGFVDGTTDSISFLDPRLEALLSGVEDLEPYKQYLKKYPSTGMDVSHKGLQIIGIGIRYFDLV